MLFLRDSRGNVAMMLALMVLPIMMLIGFAVEFGRQQGFERQAQAALDATVLSVALESLSSEKSDDELIAMAQDVFNTNSNLNSKATLNAVSLRREDAGDGAEEIILSVSGRMPTFLLGVIGQNYMDFAVESGVVSGEPVAAEIALVLDISNSMSGSRLSALQTAAKGMVEELIDRKEDDIRIGIVPFNNYVNVGKSNKNEPWVDVPARERGTYESCPVDRDASREDGCTFETECDQPGEFGSGSEGCQTVTTCPAGVEVTRGECEEREWRRSWLGCVGSRDQPLNVEDGQFEANKAPGILMGDWEPCYAENKIIELTNRKNKLRRKIDELRAGGTTYMAPGLAWGMRVLSSDVPFTDAKFSGTAGTQTIVLLSDGANTRSISNDGKHTASDAEDANTETLAACEYIKAQEVQIYTIDFGVDDPVTEALLKDCASGTGYYYEADSANQLIQVFADITDRFSSLALSR